jgi:hypothetical protein
LEILHIIIAALPDQESVKVLCKLTVVSFGEDAMPHFEKRWCTVCEEEVKGSDFCNLFVKACIVVAQRACRSSAFVCHRKNNFMIAKILVLSRRMHVDIFYVRNVFLRIYTCALAKYFQN